MKSNKIYPLILVIVICGFGFFLSTRFWGGDDFPIKNTWNSNYFYDNFYRVELKNMVWDKAQNEIFFGVSQSKTTQSVKLKLQVDVIGKDEKLYPINDFSHLSLESADTDTMVQSAYSFSLPITEWRYIKFVIQTEDINGYLSNQTILYADYRSLETSDEPLILAEWSKGLIVNDEVTTDENINDTTENIENEIPTTDDSTTQSEDNKTESLEQDYVIESEPIILDNGGEHDHSHEINDTDEPVYTLEDLQHQEEKLNLEIAQVQAKLNEQSDNQDLQKQLADLQTKLTDLQQKINDMKEE